MELWSLLEFLYPQVFTISQSFANAFDLKENIIKRHFLQLAHELLDLFMLRRLKHKVETFIPPKIETKVYCPLSKTQIFWYRSLLMKNLGQLASYEDQNPNGQQKHEVLKSLFYAVAKVLQSSRCF